MSDTRCAECGRWECTCVDTLIRASMLARHMEPKDAPVPVPTVTFPLSAVLDPAPPSRRALVLAKLSKMLDSAIQDYAQASDMQRLRDMLTCYDAWSRLECERMDDEAAKERR